jgi:hypothetical protein
VGIFSTGLWSDFGWHCHANRRSTEEAKPALEPSWHRARTTFLAASFHATSIEQKGIHNEQVLQFLGGVRATKIHAIQEESWGTHFSGGTKS